MARDSSGVYSQPASTSAVSGQTIQSSKYNELIADIVADLNLARPVVAGGTGLTTLAANKVLIGNGTGLVNLAKAAPGGDFVGTTDVQTLVSKTLTSPTINTPTIASPKVTGTVTLPAGSIETADLADNSVSLAKMAAGTAGNLIAYNASGDPVAVSTGTSGQVLKSSGAGAPPAFADSGATYSESAATTLANGASWTHGLGGVPKQAGAWAQCKSAISGIAVGDRIQMAQIDGDGARRFTVVFNSTTVKAYYVNVSQPSLGQGSSGQFDINSTYFDLVFWAVI